MNLLLFDVQDLRTPHTLVVTGRRHKHLQQTLKATEGTVVRVGQINGLIGEGRVSDCQAEATVLQISLQREPPPPLPIKLVLALPRPKMMRRVLQSVASLGIKEIHLINSYRVEKSFWLTPRLDAQAIAEQLVLGLEQCGDTRLPVVKLHKRFKPFVEDTLPDIKHGTTGLVAHPYVAQACPTAVADQITLAIGPEGGFIPYEVEKLMACGFQPVSLGPRILRVETAIPVLISRLTSDQTSCP